MSIIAKTAPEDPIGTRNSSAADIKPPLAKFRTWEEKKITDPAGDASLGMLLAFKNRW